MLDTLSQKIAQQNIITTKYKQLFDVTFLDQLCMALLQCERLENFDSKIAEIFYRHYHIHLSHV